jgi:2,3-bisphosphoglycerate-dependent phosphoglycerate mutase
LILSSSPLLDNVSAVWFSERMATRGSLKVLLVRHATPIRAGTVGINDDDRPLTQQGVADAERLAAIHAGVEIAAIYSSPYRRAFQTVEPAAARLGITVEVIHDLRERYLMAPGLPDREWRPHLERAWRDFDYAPPGGESGRLAQARVLRVLGQIKERHRSGVVMAGSHGNLIALALNAMDPRLGMEFWAAMPMPAVYRVEATASGWRIVSGPSIG